MSGYVEVVGHDVFDERAAAGPALDVDREGLGMSELAVLDADVTNPAGGLAADPDTSEDRIRQGAVGDQNVFAGSEQRVAFHAAAGFDRDTVVAGGDVAAVDHYMLAGIDIDAVAVAARAADGQVLDENVVAVGWVQRPHQAIFGREVFEAHVIAANRFDQRRMAQRVLRVGSSAQRCVADDLSRPDDADVFGIDGVNQTDVPLDPFAFPANLRHRVIGEVRCSEYRGIPIETKNRVGSERNGAGEIVAGGNEHFAAAQNVTAIDGLLNGGGILCLAVASRAEVADVQGEFGSRLRLFERGGLSQYTEAEKGNKRQTHRSPVIHFIASAKSVPGAVATGFRPRDLDRVRC